MHELGGGVYAVDVHVGGDVQEDVGVVEDHPDIGVDHQTGDLLGRGGRGRDDADDFFGLGDALLELVDVLDDDVAHGAAYLLRVVVEDVVDHETPLGEDGARRYGATEVARADQRDVVGLPEPQDVPHGLHEVVGLVADPARPGKPDRVQIPAYLYGVDAGEVAELLAGDRVAALLDELLCGPEILRQPVCQ